LILAADNTRSLQEGVMEQAVIVSGVWTPVESLDEVLKRV
jgi:hypothetical protein